MSDLIWLSAAQMRRIKPYFPLSHGVARVDDRKVISGIIFVIRNGLRWRDAPKDYGPHKTIYNRFIRWSRLGVFNKIFAALAGKGGKPDQLMIDATHLKAHRTAASLLKRGFSPAYRAHQGRPELQAPRRLRRPGAAVGHAAQRRPDERLQGRGPDDRRLPESQGAPWRQGL
jgi:putative transposase